MSAVVTSLRSLTDPVPLFADAKKQNKKDDTEKKKQEIEKRLMDVSGQLAPNKKTKKGKSFNKI